jgi:hypothetical protein
MNVMTRRLDRAETVLASQYSDLTAEQRFALIAAAAARGDDADRQRLLSAAPRITLSMPNHAPLADAFGELSLLVFVELLADGSDYLELFNWADDAQAEAEAEAAGAGESQENDDDDVATEQATDDLESTRDAEGSESQHGQLSQAAAKVERCFDMALAAGYMLKARADGWILFCQRRGLPPFTFWEELPGYARLQRALKVAEQAAFKPAGMVAWLNRTRPKGEPEVTDVGLTPEVIAAGLDRMFRQQAAFWGGTAATKPEVGLTL